MRRYTLKVFGIPIVQLDSVRLELVEDEEETALEGGSAHNFERDTEPLSPTSHHEWEWEDKRRFGFG